MVTLLIVIPALAYKRQQRYLRNGRWMNLKAQLNTIFQWQWHWIGHVRGQTIHATRKMWLGHFQVCKR